MRRALVVALLVLIAVVAGLVLLVRSPWFQARLRAAVLGAVSERLDADVRLEDIRVRLLPPSLELTGLTVTARGRPGLPPVVAARRIRVVIDPALLLVGRLDIDRVAIVEPRVHLVFEGKDAVNLPRPAGPRAGGRRGLPVVVRTVSVEGGDVRLDFPREGPLEIDVAIRRLVLRPDLPAGAADFEAAVGESQIVRRRFRQPIDAAEAEGRISAAALEIRRFRGQTAGLVAEARGRIAPFPDPELRLSGSVRGPLAAVARLYVDPYAPRPLRLEGDARATFTSSGPADAAAFDVALAATGVRLAAVQADRVALLLQVTYDRTTVRSGTLELGGSSLTVTGGIDYAAPIPFEAKVATAGIGAGTLARAIGAPAPPGPLVDAVVSGEVTVEGVAAAPRVGTPQEEDWRVGGRVALRVAAPPAAAGAPAASPAAPRDARAAAASALLPVEIAGRFDVDEQAVRLEGVRARTDPGGTGPTEVPAATGSRLDVSLSGQIGLAAPRVLALEGRARLPDLTVLEPILGLGDRGWPLEGAVTAAGVVAGPAGAPTFAGRIEATGLAVGRYRIGEVAGPISASPRRVSSEGLVLRGRETRASVKGHVDLAGQRAPVLAVDADANPLVVEEVLAAAGLALPLEGRGRLAVHLSGPVAALEGEAAVTLARARAYGQPIDRLEAAVALGPGGAVRLTRLSADLGGGRLTGRASREADGTLTGSASLDRLSLEALHAVAGRKLPLAGTATAQATIAGTWAAPRVEGRVALTHVAYDGVSLGDSSVTLLLAWPDLGLRGSLVQREVEVVGNARLTGGRPFVVAVDLNNPNLAPYLGRIAAGRAVRASARGVLRAAGSLDALEGARAELKLASLRLDVGDFYLQNVGEVALSYERRLLSVVSATFQGPTSLASLGGQVDFGARTIDLRVNGGLDLSLARLFTDRLTRSRGTLRIVAQALGPFASPRVFGAAQVEGGTLTLRGLEPPVTVEELGGIVVFDATRVVLDNLTMRIGGGRGRLTGAIELAAFRPKLYNLSASFDGVTLSAPRWVTSTSRGELRLSGPPDNLFLSGRVEVVRATYNRRIDVNLEALYRAIRAALEPRRATRPEGEASGGGPRIDVRIVADDGVRVETGLFDAELRMNLQVVGRLPEPTVLGSAEVIAGTINFRNTRFTVTSGRVDFIDPFRINPSFDLTAEATVREYQIVMRLSGTIDRYRLEFTSPSHPSLTELDILALLTVGVTTAEARGVAGTGGVAGGQISAAEALAILSGTGLRPLERQVQKFVGVDTFQIDPGVSRTTGVAEPKLTVGKRISPDVTVTYSTGLGGRAEQTFQIEYRLSTNLALVAQYDDVTSFGGGVKFRFEFR